jgi:hypothetical protein
MGEVTLEELFRGFSGLVGGSGHDCSIRALCGPVRTFGLIPLSDCRLCAIFGWHTTGENGIADPRHPAAIIEAPTWRDRTLGPERFCERSAAKRGRKGYRAYRIFSRLRTTPVRKSEQARIPPGFGLGSGVLDGRLSGRKAGFVLLTKRSRTKCKHLHPALDPPQGVS